MGREATGKPIVEVTKKGEDRKMLGRRYEMEMDAVNGMISIFEERRRFAVGTRAVALLVQYHIFQIPQPLWRVD